ncbi:aldehyde-activating protein [Archangium gephyra]|nr:aldehyde-activating protein [Archangium gephyra]
MSNTPSAQSPITPGLRTYKGSCQCGAVRFEVDFDPSEGTTRCNCTICAKTAWWGINVKPGAFRLLSGKEVLGDYSKSEAAHSRFCKVCAIRPFGHGHIPEMGGDYYSVNVNCLDGADMTGIKVTYLDGLHDTWEQLAVAPYVSPFSTGARA